MCDKPVLYMLIITLYNFFFFKIHQKKKSRNKTIVVSWYMRLFKKMHFKERKNKDCEKKKKKRTLNKLFYCFV